MCYFLRGMLLAAASSSIPRCSGLTPAGVGVSAMCCSGLTASGTTIDMQPWASSDYAEAGCLSFLSRPLRADSPLTMSDCAAFADLLEGLMHWTAHGNIELMAPRATRDGFLFRLMAARTHCDMTFGSAEEARLRCDLHVLLGEVAHCAGVSRGVLVRFSAHHIERIRQRERDEPSWSGARVQEPGHGG